MAEGTAWRRWRAFLCTQPPPRPHPPTLRQIYANMRYQTNLPGGQRAGFFLGDGAGVGKGRQIAVGGWVGLGVQGQEGQQGRRRNAGRPSAAGAREPRSSCSVFPTLLAADPWAATLLTKQALIKQHWADGGRRALWVSVSSGGVIGGVWPGGWLSGRLVGGAAAGSLGSSWLLSACPPVPGPSHNPPTTLPPFPPTLPPDPRPAPRRCT